MKTIFWSFFNRIINILYINIISSHARGIRLLTVADSLCEDPLVLIRHILPFNEFSTYNFRCRIHSEFWRYEIFIFDNIFIF